MQVLTISDILYWNMSEIGQMELLWNIEHFCT